MVEHADWQRLAWLVSMDAADEDDEDGAPDIPDSRFYHLWAATAKRLMLLFSMDGETYVEDSEAAWQEWAETHGGMRSRVTL